MRFDVQILGANSALPLVGRFPSAQVVNLHDHLFLVDCGEGAQIKLSEFKIKRSRIAQIFISHLHGDHIYGLPGLIGSYNLMGREEPLHIYAPQGLKEIIEAIIHHSGAILGFELIFHQINTLVYQPLFENKDVKVFSIPLKHRVPTSGFLFMEKRELLNIREEAIQIHDLNFDQIKKAKAGEDVILESGAVLPNAELTEVPKPSRSYAYVSDTMYDKSYFPYIESVDLLYHEATYLHKYQKKAVDRMHATAYEAALVAKQVNAKQLVLGHYSSRYKDLTPLLEEALKVFPNTQLAKQGIVYPVGND